ncbi:MAG: VanZ family protein [Candidatus Rokubacteria bacterium]|nr:VanZ family protein [Candidatus Rokubacteria bacterium]
MSWPRLLPPLAWTGLIAWFSTGLWSGEHTASVLLPILRALLPGASPELIDTLHWGARKAAHAGEYAVLAVLWSRALGGWGRPLALSVLTAVLDEAHQATTASRTGSVADVLLDSGGAATALAFLRGRGAALLPRLTTALLWVGAAGGTLLLVLHGAAGAPAGWLWVSTPAAWIALLLWMRRQR